MSIVSVIYLRVTHTGLLEDGRPNIASVNLYDLDELTASPTQNRYVPIPPNAVVDIPMSTKAFVSYTEGSIRQFVEQGLITTDLQFQMRDFSDCGGPLGTGQGLRPGVLNIERVGNVLSFVLPDIVLPSNLETVGFVTGEQIEVEGLSGAYRDLNDEYVISGFASGEGLSGTEGGSYRIEVASIGPDIASQIHPATVNICLLDGKITVAFNSNGGTLGFGADVFGYLAGQVFPTFDLNLVNETFAAINTTSVTASGQPFGTGIFWDVYQYSPNTSIYNHTLNNPSLTIQKAGTYSFTMNTSIIRNSGAGVFATSIFFSTGAGFGPLLGSSGYMFVNATITRASTITTGSLDLPAGAVIFPIFSRVSGTGTASTITNSSSLTITLLREA